MEGSRLIHRLKLTDFLSYGSAGVEIDLQPLNVLIGPNASGKSNFIEALGVLRATPTDLAAYFRERGGVGEYIRRGEGSSHVAQIESWIDYSDFVSNEPILHRLAFAQVNYRLDVTHESVGIPDLDPDMGYQIVYDLDRFGASIGVYDAAGFERRFIQLEPGELKSGQSILSQRKDPAAYPELTHLAASFETFTLFQEWSFGRRNRARIPQGADLPTDFLLPDASNLVLVLHDLTQRPKTREIVETYLRRLYDSAERVITKIQGGTVQLYIEEHGGEQIPSPRLSDGTLRYLGLLAILCHPSPPPLICIEEPELGLHPDVIPIIAELLKDAAQRTQLIVTTHSEALVSALSDVPESVVVCDSGPDGTTLRRLDRDNLASWLENYSLGEIWQRGEIGGNRW